MAINGLRVMLALALVALTCNANAQRAARDAVSDYPNRPIRIIVPYTPGGTADISCYDDQDSER